MSQPIVQIKQGAVRGQQLTSVRGGEYFSFKGIPYAQPPVGELRFKPPVPVKPWTGVKDALEEGAPAPAKHLITQQYEDRCNEDSLYINVFTPELPQDKSAKLKPVLFWIHGGGFHMGSGHSEIYGPDYLITEDVLLVTFNYRLGILGFLSLQTPECPGNFGLKDMVAALQWVQANIRSFGGDPGNVTIFGESAGGAAVQYLLLSKATEGLFHKAISQSGAALNPWAFNGSPRRAAFMLAEVLGLKTKNDEELLRLLKKVPPKELVEKESIVLKNLAHGEYFTHLRFVPVVEPDVKGAFLTKDPKDILRSGDFNDVPYIIGVTTLEGLILLPPGGKIERFTTDGHIQHLFPPDMDVEKNSKKALRIVQRLREFYFPGGFDEKRLIDVVSDVYFFNGINKTVEYMRKLTNRKSPTFLYQFSYDGEKMLFKHLLGFGKWKGTCHADELGYLFHINLLQTTLEVGNKDYKVIEALTRLWTDFAKHGHPTPKDNAWKSVTKDSAPYLDIGESRILKHDLLPEASQLWDDLYQMASPNHKGKL